MCLSYRHEPTAPSAHWCSTAAGSSTTFVLWVFAGARDGNWAAELQWAIHCRPPKLPGSGVAASEAQRHGGSAAATVNSGLTVYSDPKNGAVPAPLPWDARDVVHKSIKNRFVRRVGIRRLSRRVVDAGL